MTADGTGGDPVGRNAAGRDGVRVRPAVASDAGAVHHLIASAFRARPALDPPADALGETVESVRTEIGARGGLVAEHRGRPVGALLFGVGPGLRLTRVSVDPAQRRQRIAARLVRAAEAEAVARGVETVSLVARRELSSNGAFWRSLGYGEVDPLLFPAPDRAPHNLPLARAVPFRVVVPGAAAMRELGAALGGVVAAGDLLLLTGDLGAGKTTLTQGIGAGLGVRGPVTSPTFVIAREHPSLVGGPPLVHVDGYRLGGAGELDDLDLDATVGTAVTVVEWGRGIAEALAEDRLTVAIDRDGSRGAEPDGIDAAQLDGDETRVVGLDAVGGRWAFAGLRALLAGHGSLLAGQGVGR